jgi:hypothetical protein
MTHEQIPQIIEEARIAAREAAEKFFQEKLGGVDQYACGFAWVNIYGIKGNTKIGKAFIANNIRKNYNGSAYEMWNPANIGCQNIDTKEAGANAAAEVFRRYGFEAYSGSRLD